MSRPRSMKMQRSPAATTQENQGTNPMGSCIHAPCSSESTSTSTSRTSGLLDLRETGSHDRTGHQSWLNLYSDLCPSDHSIASSAYSRHCSDPRGGTNSASIATAGSKRWCRHSGGNSSIASGYRSSGGNSSIASGYRSNTDQTPTTFQNTEAGRSGDSLSNRALVGGGISLLIALLARCLLTCLL